MLFYKKLNFFSFVGQQRAIVGQTLNGGVDGGLLGAGL